MVEAVIGRGGSGTVYQAREANSGRTYALKFLGQRTVSSGTLERLRDEARVLASIRDRAVVKAEPPTLVGGRWAVVMEYLEGVPASKLLRVRPYPPRVALAMIAEIARALDAIYHTLGASGKPLKVLHRDIKPGNIHVGRDGLVRLLDFGTARADLEQRESDTGRIMGTLGYVAPERMEGIEGPEADVYSLGVTLRVLVTSEKAMGPGRFRPRWHRVLRDDAVTRVLELAASMQALEPMDRPTAAEVAKRGKALLQKLDGEDLGEWCLANVPSDIRLPDDVLVGTVLVESDDEDEDTTVEMEAIQDVFVGREQELAELDRAVEEGLRIVSLIGAPGIGKTRLASHWARRQELVFPGGVRLCRARAARDERALFGALASGLGIQLTDGEAEEQLLQAIKSRGRLLLILDNADHVWEFLRGCLERWADECEDVCFLITGGRPLGLATERVIRVQHLAFPEECPLVVSECMESPAIRLFVLRAQRANPHFRINAATVSLVYDIVKGLDGLPLAVELAAAYVRHAPLDQIREKIQQRQLADTTIQTGLQSELDWFWGVLQPWEKAALSQCSVFSGSFNLEAAESVTDLSEWPEVVWVSEVINSLIEYSLVRAEEGNEEYEGLRYSLEGAIQASAAARLQGDFGDHELGAYERYITYYSQYGDDEALDALLSHGGAERWLALSLEGDNLLHAAEWALEHNRGPIAARLVCAACTLLHRIGPFDLGIDLANRCLSLDSIPPRCRTRLYYHRAQFYRNMGAVDLCIAECDAAIKGAADYSQPRVAVLAWAEKGDVCQDVGRMEESAQYYERAAEQARKLGDPGLEGIATAGSASLWHSKGELRIASQAYPAAIQMLRRGGNIPWAARAQSNYAALLLDIGRDEEAREIYEQTLLLQRTLRNRRSQGVILCNLGSMAIGSGELVKARELFEESHQVMSEIGNIRALAVVVGNLGEVALLEERLDAALQHFFEAIRYARANQSGRLVGYFIGLVAEVHMRQGHYYHARRYLSQACRELKRVEDRIEHGKVVCRLGQLECLEGKVEAAKKCLEQALGLDINVDKGMRTELAVACDELRRAITKQC
jgi:predicted ATPase